MIMSWIWTGFLVLSLICAVMTGRGAALASAVPQGAQSGITLSLSIAGSVCLWTGVGKVMEKIGIMQKLSRLLRPILRRIFPSSDDDPALRHALSANICANFLGLGNAATPLGIQAAKRLVNLRQPHYATDQLCRLIVLNTASIQLIPTNVAALRASLGCQSPFDILPAVWITSLCSAGAGLVCAVFLGRVWKND